MRFLLLFLVSPAALACPDFSGKFVSRDEDTDIVLTLTQEGCASALGHYDYGYGGWIQDREMTFDGVARPLPTNESYDWRESFRWEGEELRVENSYHSLVSDTWAYSNGRIYLSAARDLVEETQWYDAEWKPTQHVTYTYRREN